MKAEWEGFGKLQIVFFYRLIDTMFNVSDLQTFQKFCEFNERNLIKYSNSSGKTFAIVQIAGLVARRIVCEVKEGQNLNQGDRIGIIRFGSRVDLYFDNDYKLLAKQGQTVVAGESLLAKI